jgi:hypothetical protein
VKMTANCVVGTLGRVHHQRRHACERSGGRSPRASCAGAAQVWWEVDRADVVALDKCGTHEGAMELQEQLTGPRNIGHVVGHNAILGLSTRAGDDRLLLSGPRDEVGAQKHGVDRDEPTHVEARPNQRRCKRPAQRSERAEEESCGPGCHRGSVRLAAVRVGLPRGVHVKAHLRSGPRRQCWVR